MLKIYLTDSYFGLDIDLYLPYGNKKLAIFSQN